MPAELDASLRWMQCYTYILLLKQGLITHPNIFITLFFLPFTKSPSWLIFNFHHLVWELATYFTAV